MSSKDTIDQKDVQKPEILKSWKIKLFVLLLCVVSFFAGWQASRSHLVKECRLTGAQVVMQDDTMFCQLP